MHKNKTCYICGQGKYSLLEEIDIYKNYECDNCSVIYSYCDNKYREDQGNSSCNFYRYDNENIKKIPKNIKDFKETLNLIDENIIYFNPLDNKVFLEIGHGRGHSLIAASEMGYSKVIGVDCNTTLFQETIKNYKVKNNIYIHNNISEINEKADVLILWHTLEHIENIELFFEEIKPKLKDDCIFMLQFPEYKKEYLCNTHYYFYNKKSITILLENNGFDIVKIYDNNNLQFLTVKARRK